VVTPSITETLKVCNHY